MYFVFFVQVHQHDRKQEQNHNRTRINNNMDNRQKLRIQQQIMPGNREETNHQINRAVNRVFAKNSQKCCSHCNGRQNIK